MTDHERINQLEEKIAAIQAKQEAQEAWMNQIMSRLVYLEARQRRMIRELGIEPNSLEGPSAVETDVQEILRLATRRLN